MPATDPNYVTRSEFEQRHSETTQSMERLTIRVEVLTHDVHQLTNQVGDIAEDLASLRAETETRFDQVDASVAALTKTVQDGHAAIISVLQQLIAR